MPEPAFLHQHVLTWLPTSNAGNLMFGLSSARVQRAIRALPDARRCDRYCGWPEGDEPAATLLIRASPSGFLLVVLFGQGADLLPCFASPLHFRNFRLP